MKCLLFASTLVAMLASVGTALTSSGFIDIEWSLPLGGVPSNDASGGGGGMFYTQIDGHSVGYNLTTRLKTFDKKISDGQVRGFVPFEDLVLIITDSSHTFAFDALAFDHNGKFLWDSPAWAYQGNDVTQYRRVGQYLFMMPSLQYAGVRSINLLTGEIDKKIPVISALFGADDTTLYAVVPPSNGNGNKTFSKFDLTSGEETVISNDAEEFGTLQHVTANGLAVFTNTSYAQGRSSAAARSLLTGEIVSQVVFSFSFFSWTFGDVFVLGDNGGVLLASKISDLPKVVSNVSFPMLKSGQWPIAFIDGNNAMYGFSQGLLKISGQDGAVTKTDASVTEVPTSISEVVIGLGAITMVPNLQGYTLWDSATLAYVGRDETVPPTMFNLYQWMYQWNGLYVNILGADLVGWKSTYQ